MNREEFLQALRAYQERHGINIEEIYNRFIANVKNSITNIFPVRPFAEKIGLKVNEEPLPLQISGRLEGNVITVNSKNIGYRRNFTIAHEIGHHVLHHGNKIDYRAEYAYTYEEQLQEEKANNFAYYLLLPDEILTQAFEDSMDDIDKNLHMIFQELSDQFDVSKQAVIIKLKNLYNIDFRR